MYCAAVWLGQEITAVISCMHTICTTACTTACMLYMLSSCLARSAGPTQLVGKVSRSQPHHHGSSRIIITHHHGACTPSAPLPACCLCCAAGRQGLWVQLACMPHCCVSTSLALISMDTPSQLLHRPPPPPPPPRAQHLPMPSSSRASKPQQHFY